MPARARSRPPGAGTGTEFVFTTVLMPEVNEPAPLAGGVTLISSVCVMVKGEGKSDTLPLVMFDCDEDWSVVVPAIVVDPATEILPPAKVPLASLVKVAGEPAFVCVKSGLVMMISKPCVPVAVVERFNAVESEIELPTTLRPTVPKIVKSVVVIVGIDAPGGEITPKLAIWGVPVGVKKVWPPDVVIVPSTT